MWGGDLFGAWLVEMSYSCVGRRRSIASAAAQMPACGNALWHHVNGCKRQVASPETRDSIRAARGGGSRLCHKFTPTAFSRGTTVPQSQGAFSVSIVW